MRFIMNLPNILTSIRFALVPVMAIFLVQRNFTFAIAIYVIASITDILDGYIARQVIAVYCNYWSLGA